MEHPARILVPTIVVSLMLVALPALVDYVPDDHRGVVDGPDETTELLPPGFHLRVAGVHPRPDIYPVRAVRLLDTTGLRTREGFLMKSDFSYAVRVAPADIERFHARKGGREVVAAIRDEAKAALREAAARDGVETLFLADPGTALSLRFEAAMRRQGLTASDLELTSPSTAEALRVADRFARQQLGAAALRVLQAAADREPRAVEIHIALGRLYDSRGEPELAEERYLAALFLDLSRHDAMEWLYARMLHLGDIDRAERLLLAGRDRVPESAEYRTWLASVYLLKQDFTAASREIEAGLDHHPGDPGLLVNLAAIHISKESYSRAIEVLEQVITVAPDMMNAQFNLGMALRAVNRTDEAISWLAPLIDEQNPNPVLLNELARAYLDKGQEEIAVEYLQHSVEANPDQPDTVDLLNRLLVTPAE